jgi:hypothetical protein
MESDALTAARLRYAAAYAAYQECARRVALKLESGLGPSTEEILEEARATDHLAAARRELLDALVDAAPGQV